MRVDPRLHRFGAIAVVCCMACPSSVTGQTRTGPSGRARLTSGSMLDVHAVDLTELTNLGNDPSPTGLSARLDVADVLQPLLQKMWRTSPTFRRQCARLAEASVRLTVRIGLPGGTTSVRALSRIDVRHGIAQSASVYLEPTLHNVHELLAHEIEHVVEQIDGVDLKHLAVNGVRGVLGHAGVYETSRAVTIGRLVAREVSSRP